MVPGGRGRRDRAGGAAPPGGPLTLAIETVVVTTHLATAILFLAAGTLVGYRLGRRARSATTTHDVTLRISSWPEAPAQSAPPPPERPAGPPPGGL